MVYFKYCFFAIQSMLLIIVSHCILFHNAYGATVDYSIMMAQHSHETQLGLIFSHGDDILLNFDNVKLLSSKIASYISKPTRRIKIEMPNDLNGKECDNNTYAKNNRKDCIAKATLKAYELMRQHKDMLALEEEAMLPHHCSFIKLRTMAFDDDVGSICVNAVLHTNEFAKYSKGYSFESIPPLACISFFFFIAIVYCYERFYYHQREAYPQSSFFLIINILHSFICFSHSEKKRCIAEQKNYAPHARHVDDNDTSLKVAGLALLLAFLPVTIAHTKSPYSIVIVEAL